MIFTVYNNSFIVYHVDSLHIDSLFLVTSLLLLLLFLFFINLLPYTHI